ncbi:MAG: hypothetical protein AAF573_07470 [Bacteroidota bacterium]
MRKIQILLLGIFLPFFLCAQNSYSSNINSAIRILKIHESSLSQLSPFDEEEFKSIIRLNRKASEKLLEVLRLRDVVEVPKDSFPFFSGKSEDDAFAVFNWRENMGGTFQQYINIFYWVDKNGTPRALKMDEEYTPYAEVFQIKNSDGEMLYLLIGRGIGCATCVYEKVLLLKTNAADVSEVFAFQIDYRLNNDIKGFRFDETTNILTYEFIEEDCEEEEGENCWVNGKFRFDGNTFVEVE